MAPGSGSPRGGPVHLSGDRGGVALPRLHLVTDDAVLALPDFAERAREAVASGGRRLALHLRGPATPGRKLWEVAGALLPACRDAGALLLVNDRVDVAAALGADGVHLGARSLPPTAARAAWRAGRTGSPEPAWLGRSVHGAAEVRALEAAGELDAVDFLVLGTIFPTPSHPGRPGAGPGSVAGTVACAGNRPVVGIGGIDPDRVASVLAAGAHGVAVLGGVWRQRDTRAAVRRYLSAVAEDRDGSEG